MTSSLPCLRRDLAVSEQLTAEGVIFVVKDAIRDRFYRLPEEAYFIAGQLDGKTQLDVIRERTEEKFKTSLPPGELKAFVSTLTAAGLLETGKSSHRKRRARIQGNLLHLRCRFFDPDPLFNFLVSRIQFFFTPQFLMVSSAIIVAAGGIAIANWGEAIQNLSSLFQLSALPLILLVVFLVVTGHEFAHGLTCKHFGGAVHELGFLMIYFQPALYCNVSDAWLFPEKSKRLWVGFAGPYFELFLWALATLVWRVTDVETGINYLAFIVMTTSGIKTLFNFNPLIKLDGYYLLSDWLGIPNLRKKGFTCIGNGIDRLFGIEASDAKPLSHREQRICLAYGLVAGIGSLLILGYAIMTIGGTLLQQSQVLLFVLSMSFLGHRFLGRIGRFFKRGKADADPDDPDSLDDETETTRSPEAALPSAPSPQPGDVSIKMVEASDTPASADSPGGVGLSKPPKPKKKKRMSRKLRRVLTFSVVGAAAWVVLFCVHAELKIKGAFDVLPIHNADVRASVEGIIEEVCVVEGQTVKEGDLIARLFDRDVRADLQKTAAAIEEAQAKLRLLVVGPRPEEIEQARIEIAKITEAVQFATNRLDRDATLFEAKLVSQQSLEDSQASLAQLKSELATAKSKLEVLLAGSRPEEIEAMKAAIASLESQRRYLDEQLQLMRVVSPASGIVATPARQLIEKRHQLVRKGDLIAKVFDLKTITAEMIVSERDIGDVKVNQIVVLKVRAYPEMTFYGKVKSIAISAQSSSGSTAGAAGHGAASPTATRGDSSPKMVAITTEIENSDFLLKPEMTGHAKIFCGERRLLDILLRRVARTVKVEFWSWW